MKDTIHGLMEARIYVQHDTLMSAKLKELCIESGVDVEYLTW